MSRTRLTDEEREERIESRRRYHRDYYYRNKEKRIAAMIRWRERNMERYKEYQKKYQATYERKGRNHDDV